MSKTQSPRPVLSTTNLAVPYAECLKFAQLFFDSFYWGGIKKWVTELKPQGKDKPLSYQMVIGLKNGTLVSEKPNVLRRVLLGIGYRTEITQRKNAAGGVDYFLVFESAEALNQFHQQLAEYEPAQPTSDEDPGERPQ
jgi:hypothetical protein